MSWLGNFIMSVGRVFKEHFNEMLLTAILAMLLVFVSAASHVHNDQLAAKAADFAGQVLAALLAIMAAKRLTPGPPPPGGPQ